MNKKSILKLSLGAIFVLPILTGCSKSLKTIDSLDVEYGTAIPTNIEQYLDKKIDNEDKTKILAEAKLEIVDEKKGNGKEYQSLGDYIVKITYQKEESQIQVSVKDTQAPIFKDLKKELQVVRDCKPSQENMIKNFKAEDLDKVVISIDDSQVNYSKEGNYKAIVKAKDSSKNEVSEEITIVIVKPEVKLNINQKTLLKNESFTLNATIKGKENIANFQSSNEKVATVDKNGKVVAISQGDAVITASANGVSSTCKVTVKVDPKLQRLDEAKKEAKKIVNSIITPSMSDYQKAEAICRYLHNNVSIQNNQSNAAYKKNFGNEAYAALVMKKAACSGFCKAVVLMCNEANIPSQHVNQGKWSHQWNKVKVSGKWIVLDAQGGIFGMSKHPMQEAQETGKMIPFVDINGNNAIMMP